MYLTNDVIQKIDSSKLNVNIRDELTKRIDMLQKGITVKRIKTLRYQEDKGECHVDQTAQREEESLLRTGKGVPHHKKRLTTCAVEEVRRRSACFKRRKAAVTTPTLSKATSQRIQT